MDVEAFCRESNLVVVIGKGGVGKTTVTAALALTAAEAGLNVLVASLDDSGGLTAKFGSPVTLGYDEVVLFPVSTDAIDLTTGSPTTGRVGSRVITSNGALVDYLEGHGLRRVSRKLIQSGALDVIATAIPGIREVLVLGKLRQLEMAGAADLILLDAPATGHAFTFLTSSHGLVETARGGPLRAQAEQVVELLSDPTRSQVLLVTIPEETPMNELIETAYRLEDEVGVALGPIVVNGCYPPLGSLEIDPGDAAAAAGVALPDEETRQRLHDAATFRLHRERLQSIQLQRLDTELPLAQIHLPYLFTEEIGPTELEFLASSLATGIGTLRG